MTNNRQTYILAGLIATACAALTTPAAQAFSFHITVNTAPLIGDSYAPFALNFQLNGGSPQGNTATISNFTFGGGSANVAPPATFSDAGSGDLFSTVIISDSAAHPYNDFYQGWTVGSTLGFDVNLTTNVNAPVADAFVFGILGNDLFNIPTGAPGDAMVLVNLNNQLSGLGSVQTFSGTGSYSAVTVTATPEPTTAITLIGGVGMLLGLRRRRVA